LCFSITHHSEVGWCVTDFAFWIEGHLEVAVKKNGPIRKFSQLHLIIYHALSPVKRWLMEQGVGIGINRGNRVNRKKGESNGRKS